MVERTSEAESKENGTSTVEEVKAETASAAAAETSAAAQAVAEKPAPAASAAAAETKSETPLAPAASAAAAEPEPETAPAPETPRAERILRGLGYCGHYLHFHSGGRSGREPILCRLHRAGGSMSQLELGSQFELKAGSLSEILAKIETAGLIERTRDQRDRRALTIRLTEAGKQEAQRAIEAHAAFRDQAFSNLTDEEQDELIVLLEKIRNRWEELA